MQIMRSVVVCHPDAFAAAIAAYRISLQAFRAEFGTAHPGQVYAGVHGTTVGTGLGLFVHDRISFLFSFAHVFDYFCHDSTAKVSKASAMAAGSLQSVSAQVVHGTFSLYKK